MRLPAAIAFGLVGGLVFGLIAALTGSGALTTIALGIEPIGTAFVDLLKMVVIPLVASVIFVGVGAMGDLRHLGKLGIGTIAFFAVTSVFSILLGMGTMQLMLPLASESATQALQVTAPEAPVLPGPVEFLLGLIPSNPFAAAAEGALLPLIVFTIFVAAATGALPTEDRDRLLGLANALAAALIKLVHWILYTAPVGVFALAAPITARSGWAMLQSLGAFILAVLIGLLVFIAVVYLPAVWFLARISPWSFLRACTSPVLIALSSASSAATLPAMLEAADRELRLSRPVSSFVIPLGSATCRAGSALFQGAGVVFLAWLYGVPLGLTGIGGVVLAILLVSFTVAGIPAGGVMSLAPALGGVGIPLDGLAVLLGVDRIPDMARTATNVVGVMTAGTVMERAGGAACTSDDPLTTDS
ncbi:MAG: dicarboxylate/amino acid:cation symporter [Gemmatimonadales bacterium]|jgi:Na+/H+-dicarboxylate symporter